MRFHFTRARQREGSVLLVSLCVLALIGLTLASYLRLTVNQNQLTARSEVWNACMPVVEAGLEEALTHCTQNSTNLASQGWAMSGGRYRLTNTVGSGYYEVSIGTNVPYEVISTGYYPMGNGPTYVSRTVQITTQMDPLLTGIVARDHVTMTGNPSRVDSFDSRDPAKSTNGRYDFAKKGDKADVACMTIGNFDVGGGNIWGHAIVPSGGTVSVGNPGKIGSSAWQSSSSHGIQPGWLRTDLNQVMPPVTVPFSAGIPPIPGIVDGHLYKYVLNGGNFEVTDLDGDVAVTASSSIYVVDDVDIDDFLIKSNATIKIYCGGSSASFNDIDNQNRTSPTLLLYGLPALTSLHLGSDWAGGVYAPNANFSNEDEVSGALVVRSFELHGNKQFHYDEAFNTTNNVRAWVVNSWIEL